MNPGFVLETRDKLPNKQTGYLQNEDTSQNVFENQNLEINIPKEVLRLSSQWGKYQNIVLLFYS
jgi:hypothetical protein